MDQYLNRIRDFAKFCAFLDGHPGKVAGDAFCDWMESQGSPLTPLEQETFNDAYYSDDMPKGKTGRPPMYDEGGNPIETTGPDGLVHDRVTSILDFEPLIVKPEYGREPSLRKIVGLYYKERLDSDDTKAEQYAAEYIEQIPHTGDMLTQMKRAARLSMDVHNASFRPPNKDGKYLLDEDEAAEAALKYLGLPLDLARLFALAMHWSNDLADWTLAIEAQGIEDSKHAQRIATEAIQSKGDKEEIRP